MYISFHNIQLCSLAVCLRNKHLVQSSKEFMHLPKSYDRQIKGSDARSSSKQIFLFLLDVFLLSVDNGCNLDRGSSRELIAEKIVDKKNERVCV